jgi:hypothetical protein
VGRSKAFTCGDGMLLLREDERAFVLNPQAAAIWRASEAGLSTEAIARALTATDRENAEAVRADVTALIGQWRDVDAQRAANPEAPGPLAEPIWSGRWRCQLRDAVVDVAVERPQHARILGRWIGHFPASRALADARIEVRDLGGGDSLTFVDGEEFGHGRGLRQANRALVALAWPDVQLCGMAHAGAVAAKEGAALLAGVSGSGKSTLIARLVSDGCGYLSDDLTPLAMDGRLVPWPMPISIKAGSWPLLTSRFPQLDAAPPFPAKNSRARLLPLETDAWREGPQPARAIVFPRFRAGDTPSPALVPPREALQRLIEAGFRLEAPISDERAEALLGWLDATPAYDLPFGNLDAAAEHVRRLIGAR